MWNSRPNLLFKCAVCREFDMLAVNHTTILSQGLVTCSFCCYVFIYLIIISVLCFIDHCDEWLYYPRGSGKCKSWTSLCCEKSECHKATVQEIQQRVCNLIILFQSWASCCKWWCSPCVDCGARNGSMLLLEMLSKNCGGGRPSPVDGWLVVRNRIHLSWQKQRGFLLKRHRHIWWNLRVEKEAKPYEELEPQSSHLARIKTTVLYI